MPEKRRDTPDEPPPSDITDLLEAWNRGEDGALDQLMPALYPLLQEMAARLFKAERANHTLQPTAVVHELYLKLQEQRKVRWQNREQLLGVAGRIMRRVLVDHARRHGAVKRGGDRVRVAFEEAVALPAEPAEILALDHALLDLEKRSKRQSQIVEMRVFAGLTLDEIAKNLGVAPITVSRDWKTARLFLISRLMGHQNS